MRRATIGSDDRAELRRSRLDEDLHLAADLINTTGLDLFGNGATAFDLPSMTISEQSSSALLKKSRLFTTQREQEKAIRAKQMRAYMQDRRHSRTRDGLRFMSLRLTNEAGGVFNVDTLRSGSQKDYARLSSAIKDIKKRPVSPELSDRFTSAVMTYSRMQRTRFCSTITAGLMSLHLS